LAELFGRKASFSISAAGAGSLLIEGLRILFEVEKSIYSITKAPNTARVEIYNLSKNNRNKIEELKDVAVLRAGYINSGTVRTIFTGSVTDIEHSRNFPDNITTLFLGDGVDRLNVSYSNRTYDKGVKLKDIVKDITSDFGLDDLNLSFANIPDQVFSKGYQVSDLSKNALDILAEIGGFEWSVQDRAIKVQPTGQGIRRQAVSLSKDTGLIDSPKKITFSETGKSEEKGWEIRALLQTTVQPGDLIKIESDVIGSGAFFKVEDLRHSGDTHGQDWNTTMRVKIT
jgi:hypothetical protein